MATTQIKKDPAPDHLKSLVGRMAAEYGVDRDKFYATLANSIFAQGAKDRDGKFQPKVPTPEEMLALLVVCDKFKLDPFTRQIFAFSSKRGKIVPIVSIDGWLSIINKTPVGQSDERRFQAKQTRSHSGRIDRPSGRRSKVSVGRPGCGNAGFGGDHFAKGC